MMSQVVQRGHGHRGRLQGIEVAGKTGTAEIGATASQPALVHRLRAGDDPRVAIAVTVERSAGQGGTVAAPIAKQVMEALLGEHDESRPATLVDDRYRDRSTHRLRRDGRRVLRGGHASSGRGSR